MSTQGHHPSVLRELQVEITSRIAGTGALTGIGVKVHDRRTGDLENELKRETSNLGLTIFVSPVLPRGIAGNVPSVCFDQADFTVRIIDAPTNQTGLDAYAVAEIVMRRLHHWVPGVTDAGPITVDADPIDDASTPTVTIFDVLFHASGSFECGID